MPWGGERLAVLLRWPATGSRLSLLLTSLAMLAVLLIGDPLEALERNASDLLLRFRADSRAHRKADSRIVILGIDDTDLATLGDTAMEYRGIAEIIRSAGDLGAAVIALDAIYTRGTESMAQPLLDAVQAGPPVVFAEALAAMPGRQKETQRLRSFSSHKRPMSPAGLINVRSDPDGVFRSYRLTHAPTARIEPSLAFATYLAERGVAWSEVKQLRPPGIEWTEPGEAPGEVRTRRWIEPPSAPVLLDFRGAWSDGAGFRHLTLRELRQLRASSGAGTRPLAGALLLVANTATGVADVGATPFGGNQPLILLHATALNDLLQDTQRKRAHPLIDAIALASVGLLALAAGWTTGKRGLLVTWLAGLGLLAGTTWLIFAAGVLPAVALCGLLWSAIMLLELARRHTLEFRERRRLRETMALYFSPRVLEDVLRNPGSLEPKRVNITALLSDLRNSTPLAEMLGVDGMLNLINRVFEIENRAVFAQDGSLEKPVGDQFLAYWGAPEPQPDATDRAFRAAVAVVNGLDALRTTLPPPIAALFGYGVALHAGPSLIANIGSAQFFHYGVVGDLINTTARIESLTKRYGVPLLMSGEVLAALKHPPAVRLLDRVVVKGKTEPIDLYEAALTTPNQDFEHLSAAYGEAFQCYLRGDFGAAAPLFEQLSASHPAGRLLAERCAGFVSTPPTAWDGVFRYDEK